MRILSIDGGGALGVGPLAMLSEIEAKYKCRLTYYFDGFAGTSTGSIIASLLAMGWSTKGIAELYGKELPFIFRKRVPLPWRSKYSGTPLSEVMQCYFSDFKFSDLERPLYIPYSDFQLKQPRVFDRLGNGDTLLSRAVTISCSAPTYFPPVDNRYADGGLLVNNPALVGAYGAARECNIPTSEIEVVSLGTSGIDTTGFHLKKNMGPLKWLKPLTGFWMQGNEGLTDFQCKMANLKSYHRFEPVLHKPFEMDDLKELDYFKEIWKGYYKVNEKVIDEAILRIK